MSSEKWCKDEMVVALRWPVFAGGDSADDDNEDAMGMCVSVHKKNKKSRIIYNLIF